MNDDEAREQLADDLENYDLTELTELEQDVADAVGAMQQDQAGMPLLVPTAGEAGPSTAIVSAIPLRLTQLVQYIDNKQAWKVDQHADNDPALLLLNKDEPICARVPRRRFADRVLREGACVFFVDEQAGALGKRPRTEQAPATNEDDWIKKTSTGAKAGSLRAVPGVEGVKVLRLSGGLDKETRGECEAKTIGQYCLVITDTHPKWDANAKMEHAGRYEEAFQYMYGPSPARGWLVCSMPVDASEPESAGSAGDGSGDGSAAPSRKLGRVEVDELRIKGVDVWEELLKLRAEVQALREQVQSTIGLPMASTSNRADLAEWMELLDHDVRARPGDVGIVHGERFSTRISTAAPGGTLFVVSSEPAFVGNLPEDAERRAQGVILAFVGRVPVHCVGDAPIDSWLVPSGLDDGSARAVPWSQLDNDEKLREQCFGVVWAHLPPDSDGRPLVLAFVSAHPMRAFGSIRNVAAVAPINSVVTPIVCRRDGSPLLLRAYQEDCIRVAQASNTIVCLDTGLGKTLIAVKLIDHFLGPSTIAIASGNKALFIVPTVVLVEQQARVCREQSQHFSRRVVELCGNRLSGWTKSSWDQCMAMGDVFVATPAIFVAAIVSRGYLNVSMFKLIIFDEVHNAVKKSNMATLMNDAYRPAKEASQPVPHILGMTASFVAGAADNLAVKRQALETLMDANLYVPEVPASFMKTVTFNPVVFPLDTLDGNLELAKAKVGALFDSFEGLPIKVKERTKLVNHAGHVLKECGMSAFIFYLGESLVYQLEGLASTLADLEGIDEHAQEARQQARSLSAVLPRLRKDLRAKAAELKEDGQLTSVPFISAKCERLIQLIEDTFTKFGGNPQHKGIIFVEQVNLTFPLAYLLNHHFSDPFYQGRAAGDVRVDAISGVGTMSNSQRSAVLENFKTGHSRILVATVALEEGLDVSDCQFIVRYSKFHVPKSHIQGAGRARKQNAEVYYFENDPIAETAKATQMRSCAEDSSLSLDESARDERANQGMRRIEGFYPHSPAGGGTVNIYNCVEIFQDYCGKVLGQSLNLDTSKIAVNKVENVRNVPPQTRSYLAAVRIPSPDGYITVTLENVRTHWGQYDLRDVLSQDRPLTAAADRERHRFFYTVVVKMHAAGYLNAYNEPSETALAATKAAVAGVQLEDEFLVRDKFSPDALDGTTATRSVPEDGPGADIPMPPPPPDAWLASLQLAPVPEAPRVVSPTESLSNSKTMAKEKADKIWKLGGNADRLRYSCEQTGNAHELRFQATLEVIPTGDRFTGVARSNKKAAEQSAAAAALPFLDRMMDQLKVRK